MYLIEYEGPSSLSELTPIIILLTIDKTLINPNGEYVKRTHSLYFIQKDLTN